MVTQIMYPPHINRLRKWFSYLDVMIAVVIVGVAVTGLMQAMASTTQVNVTARDTDVAVNLVRNIHERAMSLTMTQLDALNGRTFTTPIGSDGAALTGYNDWTQSVQVSRVVADATHDIKENATGTPTTRVRRVNVQARHKGAVICNESWLVASTGF